MPDISIPTEWSVMPPPAHACEDQFQGDEPPYFGCSWCSMEGKVAYKCFPIWGCQYLPDGEPGDKTWCMYLSFDTLSKKNKPCNILSE